jgi:hypothetical protein
MAILTGRRTWRRRAERAERAADTGWNAIERATPRSTPEPLLPAAGTPGGETAEVRL